MWHLIHDDIVEAVKMSAISPVLWPAPQAGIDTAMALERPFWLLTLKSRSQDRFQGHSQNLGWCQTGPKIFNLELCMTSWQYAQQLPQVTGQAEVSLRSLEHVKQRVARCKFFSGALLASFLDALSIFCDVIDTSTDSEMSRFGGLQARRNHSGLVHSAFHSLASSNNSLFDRLFRRVNSTPDVLLNQVQPLLFSFQVC